MPTLALGFFAVFPGEFLLFFVASELQAEVAEAAAKGAPEVGDAAGADYEEYDAEDQQALPGAERQP